MTCACVTHHMLKATHATRQHVLHLDKMEGARAKTKTPLTNDSQEGTIHQRNPSVVCLWQKVQNKGKYLVRQLLHFVVEARRLVLWKKILTDC